MAGQLDSVFKNVAKSVVATLGDSFNHTITFVKKGVQEYDVDNGELVSVNTNYSDIKVPLEFIQSEEEEGQEVRRAKIYITPDLIGNNQVTFQDKVKLTYDGQLRTAQIYDINTKKGNQVYLYIVMVRF
jgi:transcription elongation GreA/GreB family factor